MRRPERAKPDINVTPLVDVVLVLLIIFMVIVPQMEAGASVDVPGIRHPDAQTSASQPLTVSITAGGSIFLEKMPVDRAQLVDELKRHRAIAPSQRLVLKGDKTVSYGTVRAIFKDCQGLGFPGVSLQVGDRREEASTKQEKK